MNRQQSFSDIEYGMCKQTTKREMFLNALNEVIVWDEWCAYIKPFYYTCKRGPSAYEYREDATDVSSAIWFNPPDEGMEETIYDSYAFRKFMNINFTA